MKIKTYSEDQFNQFKRFLVTADSMDQIEHMYEFAQTLPFIDTVDYACAGLSLYFSRDEDRTFFLMAYNGSRNLPRTA